MSTQATEIFLDIPISIAYLEITCIFQICPIHALNHKEPDKSHYPLHVCRKAGLRILAN